MMEVGGMIEGSVRWKWGYDGGGYDGRGYDGGV